MMRRVVPVVLLLAGGLCADEGPSPPPSRDCSCVEEKTDGFEALKPPGFSLLVQPDIRTAYISRGKVVEDRPMFMILTRGQLNFGNLGSIGIQSWDVCSLTGRRSDVHRRAFNETDVGVYLHYDYSIADGWCLSTEVMRYWIGLPGYLEPYRSRKLNATLAEWRLSNSLRNPYVTPFYLLRRGCHPYDWLYVRAGLLRAIPLGAGFTLTPQWYAENGSENHFQRRYGPRRNGGKYHSGMMASNFFLELSWKATENLSFYATVHQFNVVSEDARRSIKTHSSRCMRSDLTVGMIGCRLRF